MDFRTHKRCVNMIDEVLCGLDAPLVELVVENPWLYKYVEAEAQAASLEACGAAWEHVRLSAYADQELLELQWTHHVSLEKRFQRLADIVLAAAGMLGLEARLVDEIPF